MIEFAIIAGGFTAGYVIGIVGRHFVRRWL
jgi:hypothetical protein